MSSRFIALKIQTMIAAADQKQYLIEVIIPNWNGKEMLRTCLDSLTRQHSASFSITIVDNGSSDGSVEMIRLHYPEIKLICLSTNTGFAHAINVGISQSSGKWLLLLNNDMEVEERCLYNLEQRIMCRDGYDFYALKMMNFHQRDRLDGAGDGVLRGGVGYRLGTMELDSQYYQQEREVFGACAGAALYSRQFFEEVGPFDQDFFAYLEDVDLNLRARKLGKQCLFLPDAVVFHIGSASSGSKINSFTIHLTTRNNLRVLGKNFSSMILFRSAIPLILYQIVWCAFCIKKGQIMAWAKGIIEGIRLIPESRLKAKAQELRNRNFSVVPESSFYQSLVDSERDVLRSIRKRRAATQKNNTLFQLYERLFC